MELLIDTSSNENIRIAILKDGDIFVEKIFDAKRRQSEKLLPAIQDLLEENKIDIKKIKKVKVSDQGEGFSSLRIGIVVANALAYGLGVPVESTDGEKISLKNFKMVRPQYNQEPNIG